MPEEPDDLGPVEADSMKEDDKYRPRARSGERETLERSVAFEIRAAESDSDGLTLTGYAAVFDNATRIDNWEGMFDEKIARGAFKRSINARTPCSSSNTAGTPVGFDASRNNHQAP